MSELTDSARECGEVFASIANRESNGPPTRIGRMAPPARREQPTGRADHLRRLLGGGHVYGGLPGSPRRIGRRDHQRAAEATYLRHLQLVAVRVSRDALR